MDANVHVIMIDDEFQAACKVGVQRFRIEPRYEDISEARWMAKQLATAMENAGATVVLDTDNVKDFWSDDGEQVIDQPLDH